MDDIEAMEYTKDGQEGELKEREDEMQHNLELITLIAQKIDDENRNFIRKNA